MSHMYSREGLYDGQIEMVDEVSTLLELLDIINDGSLFWFF